MNIKREVVVTPLDNGVIVNNKAIIDNPENCLQKVINQNIEKLIGSPELPIGDKRTQRPYKITIIIQHT